MGNTASTSSRIAGLGSLVGELGPDVQYENAMGDSRLLKAAKARYRAGPLVVKTFAKPVDPPAGAPASAAPSQPAGAPPPFSLGAAVTRLAAERQALAGASGVLAYTPVETENAGYLIRPWVANSLYDRISTRPFLTTIEKRWLSFQVLSAMASAHARGVPHGDLKSENVLVTTSLMVAVADFSTAIKPAVLPLDDPDDFTVFFDTSGRRTCYVAPERFREDVKPMVQRQAARNAQTAAAAGLQPPGSDAYVNILMHQSPYQEQSVSEEMDVFSAGCLIAELWRDGAPTFTLSQLFQYRKGLLSLQPILAQISDANVRSMVARMLSLDQAQRSSFSCLLEQQRGLAFPDVFYDLFYPYFVAPLHFTRAPNLSCWTNTAASPRPDNASDPVRVGATSAANSAANEGEKSSDVTSRQSYTGPGVSTLRSSADDQLQRLFGEWSLLMQYFHAPEGEDPTTPLDGDQRSRSVGSEKEQAEEDFPVSLSIPGIRSDALYPSHPSPAEDGPALILLMVILSNIRNASRPSIRIQTLELGLYLANGLLSDNAKLDRLLPYVTDMLEDSLPEVSAAACRAATQTLMLVNQIDAANAIVFSEYVATHFQPLRSSSKSLLVRMSYASALGYLCTTAYRLVSEYANEQKRLAEAEVTASRTLLSTADADLQDNQLVILHTLFQVEAAAVLADPSTVVKCTVLSHMDLLVSYFGSAVTHDILLGHMITFLNDKDWRLREAFFHAIVPVARAVPALSLEETIVKVMVQALSDEEEAVTLSALQAFEQILDARTLCTARVYNVTEAVIPFVVHPDIWLRYQASSVLVKCAKRLGRTERWALLYPQVRPLLAADIPSWNALDFMLALRRPLTRIIFREAVAWAAKVVKSEFWKLPTQPHALWPVNTTLGDYGLGMMIAGKDSSVAISVPRNEEDDAQMDHLRALGMTEEDELKLIALRPVITKLAKKGGYSNANAPGSVPLINEPGEQMSADYVQAQTVFFSTTRSQAKTGMAPLTAGDGPSSRFESEAPNRAGAMSPISESLGRQLAKRRMADRMISGTSAPEHAERRQQQLHAFLGQQDRETAASVPWMGETKPSKDRHTSRRSSLSSSNTTTNANVSKNGKLGLSHPKALAAIAPSRTSAVGEISEPGDGRASPGLVAASRADEMGSRRQHGTTAVTQEDAGNTVYSSYDGKDPHLRAHLLLWYTQRAHSRVPVVSARKAGGLLAVRAQRFRKTARSAIGPNRKPEGNMIAYFNEHAGPITVLTAALDHAFFVSGSLDGELRIWDTARLEKNVTSRSRGVYTGHNGPITACVALRSDSRCLASASLDGSVHIWRVDLVLFSGGMPRYSRPKLVSHFQFSRPGEYATTLLETVHDGAVAMILGTNHGQLTIVDLRTMQVMQSLSNAPYMGAVTAMCPDPAHAGHSNWLVAAMSNGCAVLWDLRFSLAINSWRIIRSEDTNRWRVTQLINHPRPDLPNVVIVGLGCLGGEPAPPPPTPAGEATDPFAHDEPPPRSPEYPMVQFWDVHDPTAPIATFESHVEETPREPSFLSQKTKATTSPEASVPWRLPLQAPVEQGAVGNMTSAQAIEALLASPPLDDSATWETAVEVHDKETDHKDIVNTVNILPPADAFSVLASTEGYRSTNLTSNKWDDWVDAAAAMAQVSDEGAGEGLHSKAQTGMAQLMRPTKGVAGWMLTAGSDCRVRMWDLGRAEKSLVVAGLPGEGTGAGSFMLRPSEAVPSQVTSLDFAHLLPPPVQDARRKRTPLLGPGQTKHAHGHESMRTHRAAITALCTLELPFRCIVAGDRSGRIMVWE